MSDDSFFIINNNLGGGSYKWQLDINEHINLAHIKCKNDLILAFRHHSNPSNIKLIINSLIFTDITVKNIIDIYNHYKIKIIIPIHDWFWFIRSMSTLWVDVHSIYLSKDLCLNKDIQELFRICHKIVCPNSFTFDIVSKIHKHPNLVKYKWIDYVLPNTRVDYKLENTSEINIGVMSIDGDHKGKEQIDYLISRFQNEDVIIKSNHFKINILRIGREIPRYQDNIQDFVRHVKTYDMKGFLFLNKIGESWCYTLTKALSTGLPILYNNFGSFKERISKSEKKYIINNNSEDEFYNFDMLIDKFMKLIEYIATNDVYINKVDDTINKDFIDLLQDL